MLDVLFDVKYSVSIRSYTLCSNDTAILGGVQAVEASKTLRFLPIIFWDTFVLR